mgnify:CR=1 FL=1
MRTPRFSEPMVAKHLPDMPKHIIAPAIKAYIEVVRAWPQNGGDTSILDDTVKFFTENGELKSAVNTKEIVDSKILAGALSKVGKSLRSALSLALPRQRKLRRAVRLAMKT